MIYAVLSLILAFQIIIPDPGGEIDCQAFGPTHTSGVMIKNAMSPNFRADLLPAIYEGVRAPSFSIQWKSKNASSAAILTFLSFAASSFDFELNIYMSQTAYESEASFTNEIDDIVNLVAGSGFVDINLDTLDRADIKLILKLEDNLPNSVVNKLVLLAENYWPWSIVRNPSPRNGEVVSRAGADILRIHDTRIPAWLLGINQSLEYSFANYKTRMSDKKFLTLARKHYLRGGAIDLEAWVEGSLIKRKAVRFNRIVRRLDRWAHSEVPSVCLQ